MSNLILSTIFTILTKSFICVIWGTVISNCIGFAICLFITFRLIKIDFYEFLNRVILPISICNNTFNCWHFNSSSYSS